jgi:hypothetical protein
MVVAEGVQQEEMVTLAWIGKRCARITRTDLAPGLY